MRIDIGKAEKEFRRAAERGDPAAQFSLGHAHYLRATNTGDFDEALGWIQRAAAQDYGMAQAHLGYMYLSGEGVPLDLAESKMWFRRAAEQGEPHYQCTYATMCSNGDFGSHDPKEAEFWWLTAADQGYTEAHGALGGMYGWVFSPVEHSDLVKSYMWYTLAALQEKPGTCPKASRTARDRIAEIMTSEQIAEAEQRVQLWLEEHPEAMGEEMARVWRERVAEPLTSEEIAEAEERLREWMESLEKGEDPFGA